MNKKIHIIGGGTIQYVRNHFALCAPAYGNTARKLYMFFSEHKDNKLDLALHLTKMAEYTSDLETNRDVANLVEKLVSDLGTKIIIFNAALCDFNGSIGDDTKSGKYETRLSSKRIYKMNLEPSDKLISKIRKTRKDIFLVGFKTTCNATPEQQYVAGTDLLKRANCNLVLANDAVSRQNIIITPEEAGYQPSQDRNAVLRSLVDMTIRRSQAISGMDAIEI